MEDITIYFLVFIISLIVNLICGFYYSIKIFKENLEGSKKRGQDYFD